MRVRREGEGVLNNSTLLHSKAGEERKNLKKKKKRKREAQELEQDRHKCKLR